MHWFAGSNAYLSHNFILSPCFQLPNWKLSGNLSIEHPLRFWILFWKVHLKLFAHHGVIRGKYFHHPIKKIKINSSFFSKLCVMKKTVRIWSFLCQRKVKRGKKTQVMSIQVKFLILALNCWRRLHMLNLFSSFVLLYVQHPNRQWCQPERLGSSCFCLWLHWCKKRG